MTFKDRLTSNSKTCKNFPGPGKWIFFQGLSKTVMDLWPPCCWCAFENHALLILSYDQWRLNSWMQAAAASHAASILHTQ